MLVEINLLPQKQRKRSTNYRIVIYLMLAFLVCMSLLYWQVQKYNNEIDQLQAEITSYEQNIATIQQEMNVESTNSYVELSNAVEWSSKYPIKSVAVLRHLTSLLPERGFLLTYSYTESGALSLTVQFDTKKEAAYYLNWLNDSEWTKEVKLTQLSATQTESNVETGLGTQDILEEEFLPRYTGVFEITLDQDKIRAAQSKQESTEAEQTEEGSDNQ
jgi:type IV pilus assembly protein PilN